MTSVLGSMLGTIMRGCYALTQNYGLAIILFTFFTKVILFPLSLWVQKNSIIMIKMQPELNRIKAKFFGDNDMIAEEQSKLYKKSKYNPLASLIPLLLQVVLLLGVVEVIYHPFNYIMGMPKSTVSAFEQLALARDSSLNPESSSIQLSVIDDIQTAGAQAYESISPEFVERIKAFQMRFLGFDLGRVAFVDRGITILVPLIAAFSAWLLAYAQNKMNVLQTEQSRLSQYGMMAFSVGLSLYLGAFVPAGVGLYWVAGNLFAIAVQWILNIVMDPKKSIDYDALEESKKELELLTGPTDKKQTSNVDRKRAKADYKRFFSVANKHLVFYSESNGFYKYFSGYIDYLLGHTNIPIHYITSDPNDSIFEKSKENPQIIPYYIDSTSLITLMMKMDADVVVMTMPDLETYQIKRSYVRKDIEYVNVMHGVGSVNLTYRKGALDHYDTIFVADKNQEEEIIKTEKAYNLPSKKLLRVGYPLLDDMIESYKSIQKNEEETKTVLIAPSWQKDNIVDSCLEQLVDNLKGHGYQIIVRPHPQHVRHMPEKMEALTQRYASDKDVIIQTDFTSNSTVFEADALITDWSDIAFEFAFTTLKPVLFINTPMKVMNPEYQRIDTIPFNVKVRDIVGTQLELNDIDSAVLKISEMFSNEEQYRERIRNLLHEEVFNIGTSAQVGGRYLAQTVKEHIERKKNNS